MINRLIVFILSIYYSSLKVCLKNNLFKKNSSAFYGRRYFFLLAAASVICILFTACGYPKTDSFETQEFAMGTVIIQRIYHDNAKEISTRVNERLEKIEADMTINKPGGDINLLNDASGKEYVNIGISTLYVLDKAKEYSQISNGAFDVTVGPLVKAWGVFTDNPKVPSESEIDELLRLVNYKDIQLDLDGSKAKLERKGQIVDVGGIAKGYAGDEAIRIYKDHGVKSAFISLGGNVVVLGGKPDGSPWKIGVRNPRGPEGSYIGIVSVKNKAVVSSGDYERFFEREGVRYHHILDPKTGCPADTDLMGTTIVSDLSIDADALSTTVFVLGLEEGMKLIRSLNGVEAIFVTKDKKVYITEGLISTFKYEDESKEFEYVEKR